LTSRGDQRLLRSALIVRSVLRRSVDGGSRQDVQFRVWLSAGFCSALGFVLLFPGINVTPQPGADPSWEAGLVLARSKGLAFGRDLVFTYGPLGFLSHPVLWGTPSLFAIALTIVVFAVLVTAGTIMLRGSLGFFGGAFVSALLVHVGWRFEQSIATPMTYALVASALVSMLRGRIVSSRHCAGVALMASTLTLVEFDLAPFGLLSIFATSVSGLFRSQSARLDVARACRRLGFGVSTFLVAVVGGWMLCRQPLSSFASWLTDSMRIAVGFNEAMVFRQAPFPPRVAIAFTVMFIVLLSIAWFQTHRSGIETAFAIGFVGASLWMAAKSGFVRYDGHAYRFLLFLAFLTATVVGSFAALPKMAAPPCAGERRERNGPKLLVNKALSWLAVGGVVLMFGWAGVPGGMASIVEVWGGPSHLLKALLPLVSSSERARVTTEGTQQILRSAPVPQQYLQAMKGKRVHAEGEDIATLWAIGADWNPTPIIQSFSAYTASLDERNAKRYADPLRSPEVVLYRSLPGDGHHPRFMSPAALVSFICHYEPLPVEGDIWQAFVRSQQSRCSGEVDRRSVVGKLGSQLLWAPTDSDDSSVVVGRFDIRRKWSERISEFLRIRPRAFTFSLGESDGNAVYRFDPGTASQAHLLALPSCLRALLPRFDTRTYGSISLSQTDHAPTVPVVLTISRLAYRCP
jgi:hypothetical protein